MTTTTLSELDRLANLLRGRRAVVVAGAGCSTESGIPDYRGPQGSLRTRKPMQYGEFVRSEAGRARYWARSTVGWSRIAHVRPNRAHHALAHLEAHGIVRGIITQNVDGLHQNAGSRHVVELHGSLGSVSCLQCGWKGPRREFQERLRAWNEGWREALRHRAGDEALETAPDGDAVIPDWAIERFRVPACEDCDGIIKPDVVFFGENVPAATVRSAWELYEESEVLLIVGSSLAVYSGRRFLYRAQKEGMPIGVVNLGPTRADEVAEVKVEGRLGEVLPALAAELIGTAPPT